jgi:ribosomal protein S18 acetylase RimI-like enzyme
MLTVRRYQETDHDQVWKLHKLALLASGAFVESGPWDDDLHHIEQGYLDSGGEFLVGLCDNQLVAMGALTITDNKAEIKRMRVHPDHQRQGYGQAILQQLEQRACQLGFSTIQLETTVQQESAQHFYRKNGYTEIERTQWRHFTVIHYTKELYT